MKIIVAIASYGTANDTYLKRLIQEYRSMQFDIDIVVLSNITKEIGAGVELVVGLPAKNPWSLPFGHQKIFAERLEYYDLFIYSEDDTLITENNISFFYSISSVLSEDEILGFFRFEKDDYGKINYPEIHGHFHWDPKSVISKGGYTFAKFTNLHSACYIATKEQIRAAILSGGFLVKPHEGIYDMLCTAATDIYTQCNFRKLICISHIDDFLLHHLPNKYIGTRFGVSDREFRRQIEVLMRPSDAIFWRGSLFEGETTLKNQSYSKDYYEPVRMDILDRVPREVHSVLSIGCGWGATEGRLVEMGKRVVAVPMDCVLSGAVAEKRVEIVSGDFSSAVQKLAKERFDCLLLNNVLHLVKDPITALSSLMELLLNNGSVILIVPNMFNLKFIWDKLRGKDAFRGKDHFEESGTHFTHLRIVRKWLKCAGTKHEETIGIMPARAIRVSRLMLRSLDSLLYSELIMIGRKL